MANSKRSSLTETIVGAVILLALVAIAAGLYVKQQHFHPAVQAMLDAQQKTEAVSSAPAESPFAALVGEEAKPVSGFETFDAQTLSDKIDGKAGLYLAAGFVQMQCQYFALPGDDQLMQVYVYEMKSPAAAFAVYSQQMREGRQKIDVTANAYKTQNAVYFAHGVFYVELVGSATSPKLVEAMLNFADGYVGVTEAGQAEKTPAELFPTDGLVAGSVTLLASDVFGFDKLDQVYTANYKVGDSEVTAFLSARPDEKQAAELAKAYADFMVESFEAKQAGAAQVAGSSVLTFDDTLDIVFARGRYLLGVRQASNCAAAEQVAKKLAEAVK